MVNSCRETPGPIPNPEAKPAHADGTATGRLWESKSPPTPNNTTTQYSKGRGRTTTVLFPFFTFYGSRRCWTELLASCMPPFLLVAEVYRHETPQENTSGLATCCVPAPSCAYSWGSKDKECLGDFHLSNRIKRLSWFYFSPRDSFTGYTINNMTATCDRLSGACRGEGRTQTPGISR